MKQLARRALAIILNILHWCAFAFIALFFVFISFDALKFAAADLEIAAFLAAIVAMSVVVILLFPLVFFRLPTKARIASYVLLLPAFIALVGTNSAVDQAYERTPRGALEAKAAAATAASQKARERQEVENARQEKKRQEAVNEVKENLRYIADAQQKVRGCINLRGQVPALVRQVKDSLHNPRSFEHVQTAMRTKGDNPLTGFPVVVMEYRAENGFDAIRTEAVTATIVPDDCSVSAVKEYDPSDLQGD